MSGQPNDDSAKDFALTEANMKVLMQFFSLIRNFGFSKVLGVFAMAAIWFFPSDAQHEALVSRYLLFEPPKEGPCGQLVWVVVLIITNFITLFYYQYRIILKRNENNRLGQEKSRLQKDQSSGPLHSSD